MKKRKFLKYLILTPIIYVLLFFIGQYTMVIIGEIFLDSKSSKPAYKDIEQISNKKYKLIVAQIFCCGDNGQLKSNYIKVLNKNDFFPMEKSIVSAGLHYADSLTAYFTDSEKVNIIFFKRNDTLNTLIKFDSINVDLTNQEKIIWY